MTCPKHACDYAPDDCCPVCLAAYEAEGEVEGCYHCGSPLHYSSDCHEA